MKYFWNASPEVQALHYLLIIQLQVTFKARLKYMSLINTRVLKLCEISEELGYN